MCTIITEMRAMESLEITPVSTSFRPEEKHFYNCKSCGRLMMTTNYQVHLITACPEWQATSLEQIRDLLIAGGVHYLCEVTRELCENCSDLRSNQVMLLPQ